MTRNVGGWLCALLIPWAAAAEPPSRESLPEALRGWADWVLHDERERACPELLDQGRRACGWPGFLQLTLTGQGGRFRQSYRAFRDGYFRLPGNGEHWPQEVRVDGKPAVVVTAGDAPAVRLCAGEHAVEGQFLWDVLPESLAVPEDVGLVSLSVNGKSVARPNREGGQLFFRREAEAGSEAEAVEVRVHRRVTDEIPLLLTTQVELRVSGKNRELLLGRALPEGFTPMRLESGIPARIESDGRIRLQARPGSFSLVLTARGHSPLSSLTRPEPDGLWSEEEVWVFEARPSLRQVAIEGVNAVDPQQTTLPAEWRGFPAYAVGLKDEMKLVERQRGDQSAPPDRVALQRELWLDFGGAGYSVQDRLTGRIYRSTRLEAGSGLEVGRVASAGAEQLLTRLKADGPVGVELQQGAVNLLADGRVSGRTGVSAVGWNLDVQSLSAKLHLPPGWRLFHATGVDRSGLTWIGSWSLFDLFLVLVTAAATARLYGKRMGVLALAALTLAYPEEDAPKVIWLLALAAEALVRAVTHAGAQRVLRILRVATLGILALWGVAFAVQHVREAMYPQLRRSYQALGQLESYAQYQTRNRQELQSSLEASPAEPEPQNEVLDESVGAEQEVMEKGSAPSFGGRRMKPPMPAPAAPPANPLKGDPQAAVQTGPGLPRWSWTEVPLEFSGPVERGQRIGLWLLSPPVNFFLALLRVGLLAWLLARLLGTPKGWGGVRWWRQAPPVVTGAAAVLWLTLVPVSARAQSTPSPELLQQLRNRLLESPECAPTCVTVPRLSLEVTPDRLRGRLEVSAAAQAAMPLPGNASHWQPESVMVDGRSAAGLLRTEDGALWLPLSPGLHQVSFEGPLPNRDVVQLPLPLPPRRVEVTVQGWALSGLREDGRADGDLQLTRDAKSAPGRDDAVVQAGTLPPFVRVERALQLGLTWSVTTRVERLTPPGSAVVLEVPLLPGESVTTQEIRVSGGKALLNMGPNAVHAQWSSVLSPRPALALRAPPGVAWTEVWTLDASSLWHVEARGIPAVAQWDGDGPRTPQWRPWPGEEVTLSVVRPTAAQGQTLTVDGSRLLVVPGFRASEVTLTANLRSSRGGRHPVVLPEGALLQSARVNGTQQPIRQEGRGVSVALAPGSTSLELVFRLPQGLAALYRTPQVDLGVPSVNAAVEIQTAGRWVLAVGGPGTGPAVLFWSFLLVLMVVALALGRVRWTPLRAHDWALLAVGLSQVPVIAAAWVAVWLLALGYRAERGGAVEVRWRFNLVQLTLLGLTLVALGILMGSIYGGLLGEPEMQVQGNGSTASHLRWYQDRVGAELPRAWVASVSMWVYRGVMLLWALWLAFALLRWLRWGWAAFSTGGLWRQRPLRARVVPPAAPPAVPPA